MTDTQIRALLDDREQLRTQLKQALDQIEALKLEQKIAEARERAHNERLARLKFK